MFKRLLVLFNGLLLVMSCLGQKTESPVVMASGGGFFSSDGYSLSYTYGELSIRTLTKTSNILTEGFQQGKYHPEGPTPINDIKYGPNPVEKNLTVSFYFNDIQTFTIQLFSMIGQASGSIVRENVANNDQVVIDFSGLAKGLYLVKVQSKNGKFQRILKIEKL